jgi:hypothetical protein
MAEIARIGDELRERERRRIEGDLDRVRRMHRLQILDHIEADALIAHLEDELRGLSGQQGDVQGRSTVGDNEHMNGQQRLRSLEQKPAPPTGAGGWWCAGGQGLTIGGVRYPRGSHVPSSLVSLLAPN